MATNECYAKPVEIYEQIIGELNALIGKMGGRIEDERIKRTANETKDALIKKVAIVRNEAKALEKNSEWDRLTVAFYGETKAGKSTIIETLRILFGEKTKIEQRTKFKQLKDSLGDEFERIGELSKKESSSFFSRIKGKFGFKSYCRSYDALKNNMDGTTIGDGTSDYTKTNVTYICNNGDEEFNLIDVPGIEGNEDTVKDAILEAVQKAHIVFYVVKDPRAPNEGTLEKIRQHLRAQSEVWAIFNKPITNPKYQFKKEFLTEEVKSSLESMDAKITEVLGREVYADHIVLSALPAFYAVAECLIPEDDDQGTRPNVKRQQKFLEDYASDDLLSKSLFLEFCGRIKSHILINAKKKIIWSNYYKIGVLLGDIGKFFVDQERRYENEKKNIDEQVEKAKEGVSKQFELFERRLDITVNDNMLKLGNTVREEMFKKIDEGIKDSEVKDNLKSIFDEASKKCIEDIQKQVDNSGKRLESNVKDIVDGFQNSIKNMVENCAGDNISLSGWAINEQWTMTVDDGSSLGNLLLNYGTWVLTVFTISNPWGLALATFTFGLTQYRNFRSYFSKDYEKKLQKKSVEDAVSKLLVEVRKMLDQGIASNKGSVDTQKNNILQNLETPSLIIAKLGNEIKEQKNKFSELSESVDKMKGDYK